MATGIYLRFTTSRHESAEAEGYWPIKGSFGQLVSASCLGLMAVCLSFGQTAVTPGGVVNAASFAAGQPVAPGSIVAIFGTQLASQLALADSVPLATSLAGVSVTFNNVMAPLQFVSTGQINAQVPLEVNPSGTANVVVDNNGNLSAVMPVPVAQLAPGVFAFTGSDKVSHAIAVNVADPSSQRYATISAPSGSIQGLTTFPAQVGDTLFLYATGLGPVTPAVPTGAAATGATNTNTPPIVLVGGVQAKVTFAGLAPLYPGVYQVNFIIPSVPSGSAVPLQIQMGGITSPNTTNIAIQ
jgi:uncharacterized protein (TIGR03437 family)